MLCDISADSPVDQAAVYGAIADYGCGSGRKTKGRIDRP